MFGLTGDQRQGEDFATVRGEELEIINAQRARRGQGPVDRLSETAGLATSGGGIRSASFGLGVMQALEYLDLLRRFDYLSTVSGGGYIGSSLTWFNYLQRQAGDAGPAPTPDDQTASTPADSATDPEAADPAAAEVADATPEAAAGTGSQWRFPFCTDKHHTFAEQGVVANFQDHYKTLYTPLDFIRQHGKYLAPGKGLDNLALLALVLRNSLSVAFVYLGLLMALLWLVHPMFQPLALFADGPALLARLAPNGFQWLALAGVAVMGLLAALTALGSRIGSATTSAGYRWRITSQALLGAALLLTLVAAAAGSLPAVAELTFDRSLYAKLLGALPAVLGSAGAVYQFFWQKSHTGSTSGLLSGLRIWATALLLIYGLLLLAYVAQQELPSWSLFVWLGASLLLGWCINTNLFGIGRMYRDRLMEAFLPDAEAVQKSRWRPAGRADEVFLRDLCGREDTGPYQLINCHVVLTDSGVTRYRNRGGDNFVLSHAWCGGDAIGWYPTRSFEGGEMSLATAMSISGAALNPRTGVGGQGVTRNRLVSFMLALFNVRLGFWADNPRVGRDPARDIGKPNLFVPGLWQGLFGRAMHRESPFLELTDGGHFDNTGLYELVRRRLSLIVLSLAGEDPAFAMDDLATAIERVRADFGVVILFDDAEHDLGSMVPGSAGDSGFGGRMALAARGYAVGQIQYPPARAGGRRHYGTLVVLKTVLTDRLPPEIYSYKAGNDRFPHQSTADQFFGEEQLEAYRELGFNLCFNMLQDNKEVGRLLGR